MFDDFGDLGGGNASTRVTGVVGNNTRGVVSEGSSDTDQLQFINATLGNITDFGNLSQARQFVAGMTSNTRGLFDGGFSPTLRDTIDFIEITQQVMQLTLVIWLQQIEKECLVLVLQEVFMLEDLLLQQLYKVFK